jgi:hypothetical protein
MPIMLLDLHSLREYFKRSGTEASKYFKLLRDGLRFLDFSGSTPLVFD